MTARYPELKSFQRRMMTIDSHISWQTIGRWCFSGRTRFSPMLCNISPRTSTYEQCLSPTEYLPGHAKFHARTGSAATIRMTCLLLHDLHSLLCQSFLVVPPSSIDNYRVATAGDGLANTVTEASERFNGPVGLLEESGYLMLAITLLSGLSALGGFSSHLREVGTSVPVTHSCSVTPVLLS